MQTDSAKNKRNRTGKSSQEESADNSQFVTREFMKQCFQLSDERITKHLEKQDASLKALLQPLNIKVHETAHLVQQHEGTLQSLVRIEADSKWKREKVCNVKFSLDKASTLNELQLTKGLNTAQQQEKIGKMIAWLTQNTGIQPLSTGHRIVEPRTDYWTPFYVIRYSSEVIADQVRGQFKLFTDNKIYASHDLTPLEQERKKAIMVLLKGHWNVQKIPAGRFIRDCIKCCIDNNQRM